MTYSNVKKHYSTDPNDTAYFVHNVIANSFTSLPWKSLPTIPCTEFVCKSVQKVYLLDEVFQDLKGKELDTGVVGAVQYFIHTNPGIRVFFELC